MWQVYELEDENLEFYVSATPVIWIFMRNMKLYSFWPKHNSAQKIKNQAIPDPESDEWRVLKCRILMDGAMYKTYNAARDAEKIGTDFSTISAYEKCNQERGSKRQNRSETMTKHKRFKGFEAAGDQINSGTVVDDKAKDFIVTEYVSDDDTDTEPANKSQFSVTELNTNDFGDEYYGDTESQKTSRFDSGFLITDEYDISHDSETDLEIKQAKRSSFLITSFAIEDEKDKGSKQSVESEKTVGNAEKDNDEGDIAEGREEQKGENIDLMLEDEFFNGFDFLTSTRIEHICSPQSNMVLSAIKEVELALSTFNAEIKLRLETIKKITETFYAEIKLTLENIKKIAETGYVSLEEPNETSIAKSGTVEIPATEETEVNILTPNLGVAFSKPAEAPEISNETFDISNAQNLNIEVLNDETLNDINGVKLPLPRKEHYKVMESALIEEAKEVEEDDAIPPIASNLIQYLEPFDGEAESKYFDRTILLLFEVEFFKKAISFKVEKDPERVLIKDSKILDCWKKSYAKRFGTAIDNRVFIENCRRFKNTKRAK